MRTAYGDLRANLKQSFVFDVQLMLVFEGFVDPFFEIYFSTARRWPEFHHSFNR